MKFPERLQSLRIESNMTQDQLAKKLNIKQQAVSQYEKGTSVPKNEIIVKLAGIFNVPVGFIMGISDERKHIELPEDSIKLLEIYDALPRDKKKISIELLKVLKDSSAKEAVKDEE